MNSRTVTNAAFGVLCGFGTLLAGLYWTDIVALTWATYIVARHRPVAPPWILILAAAMLPGLWWTDNPLNTGTAIVRLVFLGIIGRHLYNVGPNRSVIAMGMAAILLGQTLLLALNITSHRPAALSLNASQVSSTGLMLWILSPLSIAGLAGIATGTLHMGIGLGRTALAAAAVFTVLAVSWRRALAFLAVCAVSVLALTLQDGWGRFNPADSEASRTLETREAELEAGGAVIAKRSLWEQLRGTGWGSYYATTEAPRPHNLFILTWYEMGLLSVVPFGILGWAVWRRKLSWRVWVPLLVLAMLTEEMTGRPEGFYMLAAIFACSAHQLRSTNKPNVYDH